MNHKALAIGFVILALVAVGRAPAEVTVWELPEGKAAGFEAREGWKTAGAGSRFPGGAAVDNEWLTVIVAKGSAGPVVRMKAGSVTTELAVLPGKGPAETVTQVGLREADMLEAILGFSAGGTEASLIVRGGGTYVTIAPVTNAATLEVKAPARYVLAPSFHGDDTLYDAGQCRSDAISPAVQPMLIELLAGGKGILALLWDGSIGEKDGKKDPAKGWDPRKITLRAAGNGAARVFADARIEFREKPVHVGILDGTNIWQDIDIRNMPPEKTERIEWKRPFQAAWRANFLPGTECTQAGVRGVKSSYLQPMGKDGKLPPCVIRGEENLLAAPADWPRHALVIYPFDRTEKTPIVQFAVEDLMRQALGTGPCDLDWWRQMVK